MPTRADLDELVRANRAIRALAVRDVTRLWATLEGLTAVEQRDAMLEAVPALIDRYGEIAATVAADFYETQREAAGAAGRFTAELAALPSRQAIESSTRWAMGPLFAAVQNRAGVLSRLAQVVDDRAIGQGKRTQVLNAQRDRSRPRVARIPVGKTCAFCRMLGSRGAVYASEASALAAGHAHCDCSPVPVWSPSDLPAGYDPDALYAEFARAAAGQNTTKQILAAMREQGGH